MEMICPICKFIGQYIERNHPDNNFWHISEGEHVAGDSWHKYRCKDCRHYFTVPEEE